MRTAPSSLALAADFYNRYPGELVTYFLRFTVPDAPGAQLQFAMPDVMEVETYELPDGIPMSLPRVAKVDKDLIVIIPLEKYFKTGETYEIVARVRINTFHFNQYLLTEASLVDDAGNTIAMEARQIAVHGKAKFLRYLPELYESDDFTSRFLMLFESFWKPLSSQIAQVENHFDPALTPPEFLPWLASWIGLPVEESLPVDRLRAMIKQAIVLFQYRGTAQALKTYLEIYTNGKVSIIEQRADNFVLGTVDQLGENIALGLDNKPDFVRIRMEVPSEELERAGYSREMYLRKMNELVQIMVPAHTRFEIDGVFDAQKA